MEEIWKDVVGLNGRYKISSTGRLISNVNKKKSNYERKIQIDKDGYRVCSVSIEGKNKVLKIHRLVAEAFIHNPENKKTVNHKDLDKSNNNVENLEWMTNKENSRYSFCKKIAQYDTNDNLIKVWDAMRDAELAGYHRRHISECCNGVNKTHSGYKWSYYEDSKVST